MGRSHDGADSCLSAWNGGKSDALGKDPFGKQLVGQPHRQGRVADDDRRDRTLARPRVEAERLQAALEETRVVPQTLDELRLALEYLNGREAGGRHRRRMRRREEKGSCAVVQKLDQRASAGYVPPERANRFRQRA